MAEARFDAEARNEIARGYMLLGVFLVHSLVDMASNASPARSELALIKIFGPQVSMFFFLSGMSSRGIGKRTFRAVAQQSLMLVFLAAVSHVLGLIGEAIIYPGIPSPLFWRLLMPLVTGTGGSTYVTWFFITLAVVRILVWVFERDKRVFVIVCAGLAILIRLGQMIDLPDNIYEWRHWPFATLFMLIGMYLPKTWRVGTAVGVGAFAGGILLTWINAPDLFTQGPCLACHLDFVAGADIGGAGCLPVYLAAEILFFVGLLWGAQLAWSRLMVATARYFGRSSMQFLLLHGWFLTTIEPAVTVYLFVLPARWLILAAMVFNPLVHAGLFRLLGGGLDQVIAACFRAGRAVVDALPAPTAGARTAKTPGGT
jgi:hypothetical protein